MHELLQIGVQRMSGLAAIQWIPVLFTGFLAFLVYTLGAALKFCGSGSFGGLSWILPNSPALNEFVMFVLRTAIAGIVILAGRLLQVSNHIILSLDILYLLSLCMLFMYHRIKAARSLHVEMFA